MSKPATLARGRDGFEATAPSVHLFKSFATYQFSYFTRNQAETMAAAGAWAQALLVFLLYSANAHARELTGMITPKYNTDRGDGTLEGEGAGASPLPPCQDCGGGPGRSPSASWQALVPYLPVPPDPSSTSVCSASSSFTGLYNFTPSISIGPGPSFACRQQGWPPHPAAPAQARGAAQRQRG